MERERGIPAAPNGQERDVRVVASLAENADRSSAPDFAGEAGGDVAGGVPELFVRRDGAGLPHGDAGAVPRECIGQELEEGWAFRHGPSVALPRDPSLAAGPGKRYPGLMHEVRDEIAAWLAGRGVVWAQRAAAGQAFADVGWTSLDVIRLVAFLQSHFRIQLAPEVFFGGRAANLDALAALVHELRSR